MCQVPGTEVSGTIVYGTKRVIRVFFAIYKVLSGLKPYNHYYETDELPNPRRTQPNKKMGC